MRPFLTSLLLLLAVLVLGSGDLRAGDCCGGRNAKRVAVELESADAGLGACVEAESSGETSQHGDGCDAGGGGVGGGCCGDSCRCELCPCADQAPPASALSPPDFEFSDELREVAIVCASERLDYASAPRAGLVPVRTNAPPGRRQAGLLRNERIIPLRD